MHFSLEILTEDERWRDLDLEALAHTAITAVQERIRLKGAQAEISLLATDNRRIADLNATFRGKTLPTNVLSWPAADLSAHTPGGMPVAPQVGRDGVLALGDIALAFETCMAEAAAQSKSPADHVSHLLVHGTLHLLGYDHETDADAALMEQCEREILGKMGINDPYTE